MKSKFDEFYYENDAKNHPASEYWELYDKNPREAIQKYDDHMFCPLCKLAPLSVARGYQRRYFRVINSNMNKHAVNCSYRYNKETKKETYKFYKELDETDIRNRLVSCMNRMLKGPSQNENKIKSTSKQSEKNRNNNFLDIQGDRGQRKYLPHKNLNASNLDEDIDEQKIYYGRCALWLYQYIPLEEEEIKMYYLKVLDRNNKKQICEIAISTYVYNYLADELSQIPENKKEALNYYICFSGILQKGMYSYKCKLKDSRLLVLEKE